MQSTLDARAGRRPAPVRRRPPPNPTRPLRRKPVTDALAWAVGIGLGITLALVVQGESGRELAAPGGVLTALGRLAGFSGAYLLLVLLVLVARIPWLEREVGQDVLVRLHRRIAPWAISLLCAHALFATLGYAQAAHSGVFAQLWTFVSSYAGMLSAMVALSLLIVASVLSIRAARRRVRYETWWAIHLYTYVAMVLAFSHQLATGAAFVGHPLTRLYWTALWLSAAGVVVVARLVLPAVRNLRHQLRVAAVYEEVPGVYSIVCRGRHLDRLKVQGGQFFQWRFCAPGLCWHSHPYSLSAMPTADKLRLTVRAVGDQSRAITTLAPGTRVLVEGPYGAFTAEARRGERVALVGAGVGVTPLRAILEDLPTGVDVVAVLRASTNEGLVLRDEFADLMARRRGRLHELVGRRQHVMLGAKQLVTLIPDLAQRDVYVCGPYEFAEVVAAAARRAGVPADRIHVELFEF
jgi:predicted ferric reductase